MATEHLFAGRPFVWVETVAKHLDRVDAVLRLVLPCFPEGSQTADMIRTLLLPDPKPDAVAAIMKMIRDMRDDSEIEAALRGLLKEDRDV